MSNSLQGHGLYSPQNSPGQNTGEGSLSLLKGIFSTQGSNWDLLHCRQILYHLSYQGSSVKVTQSCLTLCNPMDCTVHGILQARILEWVVCPFSRGSSQPRSPTLQVDSLPAELQGKPKNTGVGSLSLLQKIFPTQKSNWGLLHCR